MIVRKGVVVFCCILLVLGVFVGTSSSSFAGTAPSKVNYNKIVASSIGAYSMAVKWTEVKNAKEYKVGYKRKSDGVWTYKTVSSESIKLNNLYPNAKCYVKIQSINGTSKSDWTKTKSFTTKKTTYTKTASWKDSETRLLSVIEGGHVAIRANGHITEHYKYSGKNKIFGYRCYGVSFSSNNDRTILNNANCSYGNPVHYVAYNKNGKTEYKQEKCNSFDCIHSHVYGSDVFSRKEKDSTSVITHRKGSSGYIKMGYSIGGSVAITKSGTFKFSSITK